MLMYRRRHSFRSLRHRVGVFRHHRARRVYYHVSRGGIRL